MENTAGGTNMDGWLDPLSIVCYLLPITTIIFCTWKQSKVREEIKPTVYCQKSSDLSQYLLKNCKSLRKPFRPQLWLSNKHVQTVLTSLTEHFYTSVKLDREYLTMDDGEQIAVDWVASDTKNKPSQDLLVILPGITGNPKGYLSLCKFGVQNNFHTLLISKRGHGGSRLTLPVLRGFGDGSDLQCALGIIRKRYPHSKVAVIGSSAGSALLAGYVAQFQDNCLVDVAVGISPGFSGRKLFTDPPFSLIYHKIMLNKLKKRVIEPNLDCLCRAEGVDRQKVLGAKSLNDLDVHLYSKVAGFRSIDEYWEKNDPLNTWGQFDCPFLCINSLDDPICVKEFIPFQEFEKYPNCMLLTTAKGGHCGFYESAGAMSWSFEVAVDYINTVFKYIESKAKISM